MRSPKMVGADEVGQEVTRGRKAPIWVCFLTLLYEEVTTKTFLH